MKNLKATYVKPRTPLVTLRAKTVPSKPKVSAREACRGQAAVKEFRASL